ncbi:MAG TPA: homoserine dehydrogenase [Caulobacteraceae bacterium]|jgi:homoserine dehydrogenase|nr:homoserine dehydrogenase [Caulobacteraceae bacterium]
MAEGVWRLGVAGLGTVGSGLISLIEADPRFAPGGAKVEIAGVSARSRSRARSFDIDAYEWFDDPVALATSAEVDVFVELIGGAEGPAKAAVEAALDAGKPVVTANKALIAHHGANLARLAETRGVPLLYEAAVMGGTPAVKMLREALVGEEVETVAGILNGTCNFILSQMELTGRDFAEVLAEAQRLGYAEADPSTDIGGFDAAHKITILAALAFGAAPDLGGARVEGLAGVELLDLRLARDLGFRIKLLASAHRAADGIRVAVQPALLPLGHPLARADGALNALFIEGSRIGRIFMEGPGAGAGPTAAAAAADVAEVISGARRPVFRRPASELVPMARGAAGRQLERAYLRLLVRDQTGVIAGISETLAEAGVSIDSFLQKHVESVEGVPIVLTTHPARETVLADAVAELARLPALIDAPRMMRIARV